jgi:hypothetical protein
MLDHSRLDEHQLLIAEDQVVPHGLLQLLGMIGNQNDEGVTAKFSSADKKRFLESSGCQLRLNDLGVEKDWIEYCDKESLQSILSDIRATREE